MPTLYYAHAFDHICNLIIFVTCNAFYINERTDMDSRVELVESLHPITASLWSGIFCCSWKAEECKEGMQCHVLCRDCLGGRNLSNVNHCMTCNANGLVECMSLFWPTVCVQLESPATWATTLAARRAKFCLLNEMAHVVYFDIDFMNSIIYIYTYLIVTVIIQHTDIRIVNIWQFKYVHLCKHVSYIYAYCTLYMYVYIYIVPLYTFSDGSFEKIDL